MLKLLPHVASPTKIARVPVYLIHYLTSKCNARCPHCFIFNEGDTRFAGKALSADEIDKMTRSMGQDAYNVMLTGEFLEGSRAHPMGEGAGAARFQFRV